MMGKIWKRSISFFLALVMVMSVIPMGAFAEVMEEEVLEEPASSNSSESFVQEEEIADTETPGEDEESLEEDIEEDPVDEGSDTVFLLEGEGDPQPDGIAWVDADESTTVDEMLPIALDGGIKFAVLRALDLYDERDNYTVKYDDMDVGSSRVLIMQAKKAEELAEDMKASVKSGNLLEFEVVDNNGSSAFYLIKLKSFKNTDINETVAIREKVSPDDLDAAVESEIRAGITVDGIAIADLPEDCVTVTFDEGYSWPADGKSKTYTGVVTATITEGMTGVTKTVSGGTVILEDTTRFYTVSYMIDANKAYKTHTLVEGSALPAAPTANPTKQYYNFVEWEMTEGSVGEDGLQGNVVYTAKWDPKLDNHTPGVNDTPDGIADQEQKFVITFRDDVNGSNTVTQELLYGSAIERPDPTAVPDGCVFNGWVYESGVKANVVKGNTTYKAQWSTKLTYTDGVEDEEIFADKEVTKRLGSTISHIDVPAQREGFTFAGWKQVAGKNGTIVSGPATYEAVWKSKTGGDTGGEGGEGGTGGEGESGGNLENPDDNPVVEPEYITVTYTMEINGKWYDNEEVVPKNSNGFLGWYATEDPVNDDTVVLGWYPAKRNDQGVLCAVFKKVADPTAPALMAEAESDEILVPLDEVDEYIKNNIVSEPYDFSENLAGDLQLVLITGKDTTDDGKNNIDGGYAYTIKTTEVTAADGLTYQVNTQLTLQKQTVDTGDGETAQVPVRNVLSYYRFYDETGALIEMLNKTMTGKTVYDADLVNKTPFVYHIQQPKVKFVSWKLDEAKTEGDPATDSMVTYHVYPVTSPDENRNGVYDLNEDAQIYVNNKALSEIELAQFGTITVTDMNDNAISVDAYGKFTFDTVRGAKIKVTGMENVIPTKIKVYDFINLDVVVAESGAPENGVLTLELTATAQEELDASNYANYMVAVYFAEITVKDGTHLTIDENKYNNFTDAEVYEAVTGETGAQNPTVTYVARKADSVDVSVEPIFQWMADNYSDRMVSMLDSFLGEYSGINTDANGNHYVTVTYETDVVKSLEYKPDKYWTAQDVANFHVKDYISRFVAVMESDPETRAESDMAPIDMITELLQLAYKIRNDAVATADLHPFGYNAEGTDTFTETVTLSKTEYDVEVSRDVTVNLKDNRAVSGLTAKGDLNITYGAVVTTAMTGNVISAAAVTVPVEFSNQPAGIYTDVAVVVPGGSQYRPARVDFTLTIEKGTANVTVPTLVTKEHTANWDGSNNPAPTVTPDAEVISVIAGLDLTGVDMDVTANLEDLANSGITAAGVDPVIWIRLSNTVINLIDLLKEMGSSLPEGTLPDNVAQLVEKIERIDLNGTMSRSIDETIADLRDIAAMADVDFGDSVNDMLDKIGAGVDGNVKVCFSDDYPENPGMYLNVAIVADANYKHGICKSTENKDFGVILVSPVLAMPNNGIELYTEAVNEAGETEKLTHLVFTEVHNGQPHALKVMDAQTKQDVAAEVYYYGFNNELAVHYEGGQTAPTKAGMYIVTAVHENKSDMAVMLIGMQRSTVEIPTTSNMVYAEGVKHRPEIKAYGEYDVDKTVDNPSIGRTIISGEVEVDGTGLKDLKGIVNIDLPGRMDQVWPSVVEYMETKTGKDLNDDITKVELTPAQTKEFLVWCQNQIASDIIDAKLEKWRHLIPDRLLDTDRPESLAIRALQEIIDVVDDLINRTNGKVVTITFQNEKEYEASGFYLYYAIVTDPNYLPSMDAGIMSIGISEEDFQLVDTYVPYNGKEQDLTPYVDNSDRSYLAIVQDGNNYNILLDSEKEQAILEKLEKELGITSSTDGKTFTVQQLYNYAQSKTTTKAKALVDLIVGAVQERALDRIDNKEVEGIVEWTETEIARAKAYVNNHIPGLTADLYEALADIDKLNMTDTITINGKKPVDVGTYKYRVISYAIAYREADLFIEPVHIEVVADNKSIPYGTTTDLTDTVNYYSFAGNAIEGKNRKDLTEADLAGIEIPELSSELAVMNDDVKVTDLTTLNVGTYPIVVTLGELDPASKNFVVAEPVEGTLTVTPISLKEAVAETVTYNGEPQTAKLTVTAENGDILTESDYTVVGNVQTNAGKYTVIVTGTGNYTGEIPCEWTINPAEFTAELKSDVEYIYNGSEQSAQYVVKFGNTELAEGTDYTVTGTVSATNVADVNNTITITGVGNFEGCEQTIEWNITPAKVAIQVKDASKFYGESNPVFEYEITEGTVYGEDQLGLTFTCEGVNALEEYPINATAENKNYDVTVKSGNLTIDPASVVIRLPGGEITYGDDFAKTLIETDIDVKRGMLTAAEYDNIIKNVTLKVGTVEGTKWTNWDGSVGEYTVTHTGDYQFMNGTNIFYVIRTGALKVNPKAATLKANDAECFVGEQPELTYEFKDADGNDIVDEGAVVLKVMNNSVAVEDLTTLTAGTYEIEPEVSKNYTVTNPVNGTLTVKEKIAVTVKAEVNPAKVNVAAATLPTVTVTAKDADGKDIAGLIDQSYIINGDEALTLTDAVAAAGTYTITPKYDETVKGYIVTVESAELVVAEYAAYNEAAKEYYFTLQEAVDAADENGVITLLKDGETAIVGKTITILREHEGTKYEATVSALKDYTVIEDEGQTRYEVKEAKALEDETDEPALAYIDLNKNGTYDPTPAAGTADEPEVLQPLQKALYDAAKLEDISAENPAAVRLTVDHTGENKVDTVVIPSKVALDIQGYDLEADYVIGINGSYLFGNTNDAKLIVPKKNVELSEVAPTNTQYTTYSIMPVWYPVTEESGYYLFSNFALLTNLKGQGLMVEEDKFSFVFRHVGSTAINTGILKDGADDNELKIEVYVEWETSTGVAYEHFVYNNNQVGIVANANDQDYTFEMTNYAGKGKITLKAMVITESGVQIATSEFTVLGTK